jgi:hypothetical protein
MNSKANYLCTTVSHMNGGIEQALLQLAEDENCISDKDKLRLNELKSLPQNRIEVNGKDIFNQNKAK